MRPPIPLLLYVVMLALAKVGASTLAVNEAEVNANHVTSTCRNTWPLNISFCTKADEESLQTCSFSSVCQHVQLQGEGQEAGAPLRNRLPVWEYTWASKELRHLNEAVQM